MKDSSTSSSSLGSTSDSSVDMPLQLEGRLVSFAYPHYLRNLLLISVKGNMRDYQDFSLFSELNPDDSNTHSAMLMALDLGLELEPFAGLGTLGLSSAFATQPSHPVTPVGSGPEALGKSCMQNYQNLNSPLPALYTEHSNTQSVLEIKTDPNIGLEPLASLQALGLSTPFTTKPSHPGTPIASDTESLAEGSHSRSCSAEATSETHAKVCISSSLLITSLPCVSANHESEQTKRRLQNRQAQRRFRERKDEYLQALKNKTASLEAEYQELLEKCNQKSEEASRARKEVEILSRENEDLRKRWRLIVLLLSLPNKAQSATIAAMLLGSEQQSQYLSSASITEPAPALKDAIDC